MTLFLDTNIVLYAFGSDKDKRDIALGLMLASALKAGCQYLYSEDMQHGQLIENRLHVINPFLEALEL